MPRTTLVMATRVDIIGQREAEPVTVELYEDGTVDLTLDDGQMLQLDGANTSALRGALAEPSVPAAGGACPCGCGLPCPAEDAA